MALLSRFFLFVFVCKSPLWPEGTSARLIPGRPGSAGREGSKVKKRRLREEEEEVQPSDEKQSISFGGGGRGGGVGGGADEQSAFTCGAFWIDALNGSDTGRKRGQIND